MTDGLQQNSAASALSRRQLLRFGIAGAASAMLFDPSDALASRFSVVREVRLFNVNTGERLNAEYWVKGQYLPDAMRAIDWVMRDHRTDQLKQIDPGLLDILAALRLKLEAGQPYDLISGYRSKATNAAMRARSRGVARNSYHTKAQAVDVHMPGVSLVNLMRAGKAMRAGGVGYYPRSGFVHLDVGPVRTW